ncbi:MAG: hypothetical protein ABFD03_03970 [Clostridiaceae bacterium]
MKTCLFISFPPFILSEMRFAHLDAVCWMKMFDGFAILSEMRFAYLDAVCWMKVFYGFAILSEMRFAHLDAEAEKRSSSK